MTDYSEILKQERNADWRVELRNNLTGKERTSIERVKMTEEEPCERIKSQICEVNKGLTADQARREACRCLDCVTPTCIEGCPVGISE